jgi:hypothetical protein
MGVLVGAISMLMLWTILFTSLSGEAKFAVFALCIVIGFATQTYALKELKRPGFWRRYNLVALQQEIRNYRWFGLFAFGVTAPYMLSLFVYVVLKNL